MPDTIFEQHATFQSHIAEIRRRLFLFFGVFFAIFLVCYGFKESLFSLLAAPLSSALGAGRGMIFTHVTEGFFVYVKTAFFAAFCLTFPFGLYQIWAFVRPGLYHHEQKTVRHLFWATPALFYSGSLFAYFLVIPGALHFFLSFESMNATFPIQLEARMGEYLSLIQQFLFAFGFCFLTPIVLIGLHCVGLVYKASLKRARKFVFVGILIVAAFLTPPDVFSQILLALPMYLLFELSIYFIGEERERA